LTMSSSRQERLIQWAKIAGPSMMGWILSDLIIQWLVKNLDPYLGKANLTSSTEMIARSVLWLLAGCFAGYTLGVFQAGGLSTQSFRSRRWPLTTMVGLGLANFGYGYLVLSDSQFGAIVFSLMFGVLLGGLVGWLQWLILRRRYSRAVWWIPINIIIWTLGLTSIFARSLGSWGGVSFIVAGALTGAALLWLLRYPILPQTPEEVAPSITSAENSNS
jgi:hypothetical protein